MGGAPEPVGVPVFRSVLLVPGGRESSRVRGWGAQGEVVASVLMWCVVPAFANQGRSPVSVR